MGKEAKFVVRLSEEERQSLQKLILAPRVAKAKSLRARMLLKADVEGPGWADGRIAGAFEVSVSTVHRLREQLVEEGLEAALSRKRPSRTRPRKLDGAQEASLIATACSQAPEGRTRWTLRLLADKVVELQIVDAICPETVRQVLKKTNSSRGSKTSGVLRPKLMQSLWPVWKMCSRSTLDPTMCGIHRCVWMR